MWEVSFLQGSGCARMLAARRAIKSGAMEVERTPLLLPSFSSKGFPQVAKILETMSEVISGPILVSQNSLGAF